MNAAVIDPSSRSALQHLALRLKPLRDSNKATQFLWLAAEGRVEVLSDGRIGFWSRLPSLLKLREPIGSQIRLRSPIQVSPVWPGPSSEAAIWGAFAPEAAALELDDRGKPVVTLKEFELKLRVEAEDETVEALTRPRRRGPARLYPRLARRAKLA